MENLKGMLAKRFPVGNWCADFVNKGWCVGIFCMDLAWGPCIKIADEELTTKISTKKTYTKTFMDPPQVSLQIDIVSKTSCARSSTEIFAKGHCGIYPVIPSSCFLQDCLASLAGIFVLIAATISF